MFLAQAVAQPTPPSALQTIEEGLRRQAERERAQQEASAPHANNLRPTARGKAIPDLPQEQPCFVLTEIAFTGADTPRLPWLTQSITPFLNRCVGAQGIALIAAYIDSQLIERGYVTSRVSLGPQNLAAGRVEFRLNAGRVAQVRMADADAPKHADGSRPTDERWGTWRNAFPTRPGDLLNARDLEQGVEQMKRLPSQSVTMTLSPGESRDTSVVTIERRAGPLRDRLRGGVSLDNSGGPILGRTQASANLSFDNPLGLNDIVSLNLNGNAEQPRSDHRSQSIGLGYSIPLGYSTLSANFSHSRYAQIVNLPTLPHLSSGESDSAELKLHHIAWRSASAKAALYASLSTRGSRSFLDDTELLQQARQTTFFETGASFKQLFANNASAEIDLGHRQGVAWIGAQADPSTDTTDASIPTTRPRIWMLNASLTLPFEWQSTKSNSARAWQYSATFKAQSTSDHTLSIDQMAIGGRGSVRGFDGDSVLLAESGWYLRNELSTPLQIDGVETSLYAGLDYGRVWGANAAQLPGHNLAGAAIGLRGKYMALQFDLAVATPLLKPEGFNTGRANFYVAATSAF